MKERRGVLAGSTKLGYTVKKRQGLGRMARGLAGAGLGRDRDRATVHKCRGTHEQP